MQYEARTGNKVDLCGFIRYNKYFGGSPDGLVGEDGIVEIKCPYSGKVYVKYLLLETQEDLKKLNRGYYTQIQGNLIVTSRKWCDFIAYDPRVQNPDLALKILRVERDEPFIDFCLKQLKKANKYKEEIKSKLLKMIT